jgi:hypothetical protein
MDYLPHGANQRHIGADRLAAADAKRAYTQQHYDTQAAIDIGDGGAFLAEAYFPPVNRVREEADYHQIRADFAYLCYAQAGEHTADGGFTVGDAEDTINMLSTYLTGNRFDGAA